MEKAVRPVHTCDGCDKSVTGDFPLTWMRLRVYQRTETSARAIYNMELIVCSTSCGTPALIRYHESLS